ncbi:MAG TPA: LacI family DNA-binding transcriptional regulator [Clostridia bacterium]
MPRATIKDVAKRANVSVATVSRVINGNYNVSPELSEKVMKVIKELDYYPNSVAQSLKKDATYTIGFLVSNISNNYFTSIAKMVEDEIKAHDYNLIVCSTENNKDRELAYLKLLLSKKIDGLILNTTGMNDDYISSISNYLPIVLINRRIDHINFNGDFVDSDNVYGGYALTKNLISLGHRKIGVINGSQIVSTGRERFEGFKKAMAEIGISEDRLNLYRYDGNFDMESGYRGAAKLMESEERPTAVVIMNNEMALGALRYFRSHEINIPDDISVTSYGDIINSDLIYVQLTVVSQNTDFVGKKIADLIVDRISKKNKVSNREIIYAPHMINGTSVKKI